MNEYAQALIPMIGDLCYKFGQPIVDGFEQGWGQVICRLKLGEDWRDNPELEDGPDAEDILSAVDLLAGNWPSWVREAKGAIFSSCRTWRYSLVRTWNPGRPPAMFIGLNPSTATETVDDPTVRRCIGYARAWGFGRLIMTNAFAYRSTDPTKLTQVKLSEAVGPKNNAYLKALAWATSLGELGHAGVVVVAWGNHGALFGRDQEVRRVLDEAGVVPQCLGLNGTGQPKHPLYLRRDAELVPY
jgi:hypothetical protein